MAECVNKIEQRLAYPSKFRETLWREKILKTRCNAGVILGTRCNAGVSHRERMILLLKKETNKNGAAVSSLKVR